MHQGRKQFKRVLVAATIAVCAAFGLIICLPGGGSHAQQQERAQVVQMGTPNDDKGKRIALVIGNGAYTNAPPLKNPPNDARDMADTLSRLGFSVEHGVDLNQKQMKFMIRQFGQKLKAGGQGVFYYAGHGVQSKGRNYLIPVDAAIESEADIEDQGVDVQLLLNYMDDAQNGLNIVILDACRTNPFARSMRSAENGLAQVDAPTGTLIAYSTAPGRVASDGTGKNGLYTAELLKQMRTPGLGVTDMFMRVRAEVVKQTGGKQVPWEASSLIGLFSFNPAAGGASSTANKQSNGPTGAEANAAAVELAFWNSIQNSTDAEDFKEYLAKYPSGAYAGIAHRRLAALSNAQTPASPEGAKNTSTNPTGPPPTMSKPSQSIKERPASVPPEMKDALLSMYFVADKDKRGAEHLMATLRSMGFTSVYLTKGCSGMGPQSIKTYYKKENAIAQWLTSNIPELGSFKIYFFDSEAARERAEAVRKPGAPQIPVAPRGLSICFKQ
ncbi:MAG: caspase family protein [Acidobacteriota bacterium]|nr:caspase family protein [Acidobacteriota bacterium]